MRIARPLVYLAVACLWPFGALAASADLDLTGYQEDSGAITATYYGSVVDPYFATKALLLARDGKLNTHKQTQSWIKWALSMQRSDGLFERYKRNEQGGWQVMDVADADDAMLALWIELLYRSTPGKSLPANWQRSVDKAQKQLDALFDPKQKIYHISKALPVGLLMDNMEIYAAYKHIERECRRMGKRALADDYEEKAAQLREGIFTVFSNEDGVFSISTQPRDKREFYPDRAAQIFPMMYELATDEAVARDAYDRWLKAFGRQWLEQRLVDFPWGLVAIASLQMKDMDSAACWQEQAEPMRYSARWNVLEEVANQYVLRYLSLHQYNKVPCIHSELI